LRDPAKIDREFTTVLHPGIVDESIAEVIAKQRRGVLVIQSWNTPEKRDHSLRSSACASNEPSERVGGADSHKTRCKIMPPMCEFDGRLQVESVDASKELIRQAAASKVDGGERNLRREKEKVSET